MIASDYHDYVYVAIPKTASAAVRDFLCKNYRGKVISRYHSVDIPEGYRDCFRFTVVRNPYERCLSRYFYEKNKAQRVPENIGFLHFMEWLSQHQHNDPMPRSLYYINMTQKEFYDHSGCDTYIKIEDLDNEIRKLPFVGDLDSVELPVVRKTQNKPDIPFEEYFLHNLKQAKMAVREYCEADFWAFNYEV